MISFSPSQLLLAWREIWYIKHRTQTLLISIPIIGASLGGSLVVNPPATQEPRQMRIWSLGWEDPLVEKNGNPLQSSFLETLMEEEPGGLQSIVSQRVVQDWSDLAAAAAFLLLLSYSFLTLHAIIVHYHSLLSYRNHWIRRNMMIIPV